MSVVTATLIRTQCVNNVKGKKIIFFWTLFVKCDNMYVNNYYSDTQLCGFPLKITS